MAVKKDKNRCLLGRIMRRPKKGKACICHGSGFDKERCAVMIYIVFFL